MLSSSSSPPLLLGSVVCDSMDHWFAPVKHRSELGSSCPLHCSTPHAVVCVHESSTMLNVYLLRTAAHQTWSCCRQGMQVSGAWQHLISCSDKRHYQVFWMLSRTVALHFADAAEATRRRLIGECQKIRVWTRSGFQTLYGQDTWSGFSKAWLEDAFNRSA